jgi:peptide/nickel transport system substrate-binding protein
VTSGPFDQGNACYDASIAPLPYDLEAAKKLLDEAGWMDGDHDGVREKTIDGKVVTASFSMILYGNSVEYETLARVYREALLSIGVKMDARPVEWAAQLKALSERDFDAYSGAWVPDWNVDLTQIWSTKAAEETGSSNYISFSDPEADKLIDALRVEFDPAKRVEICHAFHKLVAEDQPYTFFYQRERAVLHWDYMNMPFFSKLSPPRDLRYFSFASDRP